MVAINISSDVLLRWMKYKSGLRVATDVKGHLARQPLRQPSRFTEALNKVGNHQENLTRIR